MSSTEHSSSWARRSGGTGSWATSTIASIARSRSSDGSAVIAVHRHDEALRIVAARPHDRDVAEQLALLDVDEALLEQLEYGEEADDHVEALGEAGGEPGERDRPGLGQRREQLGDGVG